MSKVLSRTFDHYILLSLHPLRLRRILLPTDIINIDVTLYTKPPSLFTQDDPSQRLPVYTHGDSSVTFCLPEVDDHGRELVEITQEALDIGIKQCGPGRNFRDIGCAIE
jgi:methionyl aminopeptidase